MLNTVTCLTLRASKGLRGWLIASHALPLILLCLHRPEPLSFLFTVPAVLLWWQSSRALGLFNQPNDIVTICSDSETWLLTLRSGERYPMDLYYASGFYSFWQFLIFKDEKGRLYRLFVARDSMDRESFRRLRVLLRFRKKNAGFRF